MTERQHDAHVRARATRIAELTASIEAKTAEMALLSKELRKPQLVYGAYTVVRGKLAPDDARSYYVTGPTLSGRIAPLASFWFLGDAQAWAKERS